MTELQIPDYTLHLAPSLTCPTPSPARVALYTHKSITVKRRPGLEENNLQLVTLEVGLPGMKKSIYMVAYRPWQLRGHPNVVIKVITGLANTLWWPNEVQCMCLFSLLKDMDCQLTKGFNLTGYFWIRYLNNCQ